MSAPSTSPLVRLPFAELQGLLQAILQQHGCSEAVANVLAHNCASAQRDGAHSHGVFRIPGYVSTLASGWVDGRAIPQVTDLAPGYVRVDAAGGFAQPAPRSAWVAGGKGPQRRHCRAGDPQLAPFRCTVAGCRALCR